MTRALHLYKIEKNPGVLPVREGTALVSYDKWIVIKILDVRLIREDLDLNINRFKELNRLVGSFSNISRLHLIYFNDVQLQVNHMLNITLEKYTQLIPNSRQKRGLINPLGSLIKIITGNLDHSDAIKYDNLIKEVKSRQHSVEKKTTLVAEMVKIFTNSTVNITNNLIQLNLAVNKMNKNINEISIISHINQIIHAYNLFLHNFQIIYAKLNEIENIIAFSRIGILHQSIVNTDELVKLLKLIERHDKLIFPSTPENIVKIEQSITLKSYFKNFEIMFVMEIPLVKKDTYFYYKIVPLPVTDPETNLTLIILPKYPYLIVKGLNASSLPTPCKPIEDGIYLCDETQTIVPIEDTCILDLMRYSNNVSCVRIPIELEEVKIEPLQTNRWILYTKSAVDLTRTCANEILHYTILGTYLLTIDDKCEYKIAQHYLRDRTLKGEKFRYPKLPFVKLPENLKTDVQRNVNPVKLSGVDLTDLKVLSYALKNSEVENESVVNTESISVGTIVLYIILIIGFFSFILYKYSLLVCNPCKGRNHPQKKDSSGNFELKEGGVTTSDQYRNCVLSINAAASKSA